MMFDMQRFKQPWAADRIHPFWFWNGEMTDEQITHQIDEMSDKGLGGFFICARQGLKIPYLSDTWFQKVRFAVEAAKNCGLHVWLYDEYPYPSGIAGGEVILEHPDAKHYTLTHTSHRASGGENLSLELPWARVIYAKAVPVTADGHKNWEQAVPIRSFIGNYQADSIFQKTGLTAYNQKRFFTYRTIQKLDWKVPPGEWEVLIIQEKEIEDFKYYGTFVDPCNQEAMAAFIRLTHDKYAHYLSEYFGTTIKGMFTDEIGLLGSIPWSPKLAAFFLERNGYDLLEHLHALIDPQAHDAVKIRYDYYQSVHLLLRESYHKQVHDWCELHGLQYVAEVPSVRHTTQLFSHVPAGDTAHEKLGRSLDWILNHQAENFRSSAKMVSSLARQLGRERNLIECFHSVGWSMTLQDARWMIDRMAAQGTNFFNFHAFFYTLDGLTQHDAPPSQFLQNPYWEHFRKLGDYTGRISYVMSSGEAVISAAVLQPTTSLWTRMGNPFHGFSNDGEAASDKEQLESLKQWWVSIFNHMTLSGRDFDHLDPELLAGAEISNGMIKLGNASYSLLILPPMSNLESGAWAKIEDFLQQGGTVISLGQLPYETIETKPLNSYSIAQAFGLSGIIPSKFWESYQQEQLQWHKGTGSAYHLPFQASMEMSHALEAFAELMDEILPLSVRLLPACGDWGLLMQTRRVAEDKVLVFISNQEETQRQVELRIEPHLWAEKAEASVSYTLLFRELSLEDGEAELLQQSSPGELWKLPLQLASYESRLIEISRMARVQVTGQFEAVTYSTPWKWEIDRSSLWEMKALQPNVVRFDTFTMNLSKEEVESTAFSFEGATVQAKTFIDQCADLSEFAALPVAMRQMFGTPMTMSMAYPLQASYKTEFMIEKLPEEIRLLMDQSAIAGKATIRINGHALDIGDFKPVFVYDHKNISQEIKRYMKEGVNELAIDVEIGHDGDGVLDAVYFTGDFHVRFDDQLRPVLTEQAIRKLPLLAGPYEGYPYYAGIVSFSRTLELPIVPDNDRFELTFSGWDPHFHDCAEVFVNGKSLGTRTWSPYRWIGNAELLRKGEILVEVKVTNTLIGMLEGKYFDYAEHAVKPVQERKGHI
jgi:hypothetical protein